MKIELKIYIIKSNKWWIQNVKKVINFTHIS